MDTPGEIHGRMVGDDNRQELVELHKRAAFGEA